MGSCAMAYLAALGDHAINEVAELHARLLKSHVLRDFCAAFAGEVPPSKTNGVTPAAGWCSATRA